MLTHVILADMVKVRGQVSELALCLIDEEPRIQSLTKLFFTEFAKKSTSPVYNLLPDIVSSLSSNPDLSSEGFREVLGFLITFIQKDKQTESMVEKLCARFDTSDAVKLHREVAFCLSSLTHTDKSVRKLIELYKTYGNKLGGSGQGLELTPPQALPCLHLSLACVRLSPLQTRRCTPASWLWSPRLARWWAPRRRPS